MQVSDASLDSEAKLLLPRAGNCTVEKIWVLIVVDCKILFRCSLSFSALK